MSLLKPETMRDHRARWFVYSGDELIPFESTMRGLWGYDVKCSCGWDSHTGGATKGSVTNDLFDHRFSAECAKETDAEMTALGLDPTDNRQVIDYLKAKLSKETA